MRFWDTSALVPLLVAEPRSAAVEDELDRDPGIVVWWASEIEGASALARLDREGDIAAGEIAAANEGLARLAATWQEVHPAARVRQVALRVVRTHPLRAGDALQLAAAIVAADGDPRALPFVTLDGRLAEAARREGFPVVEPA